MTSIKKLHMKFSYPLLVSLLIVTCNHSAFAPKYLLKKGEQEEDEERTKSFRDVILTTYVCLFYEECV